MLNSLVRSAVVGFRCGGNLATRIKLIVTLIVIVSCAVISSAPFLIVLSGLLLIRIAFLTNKKDYIVRLLLFLPFIFTAFALPVFFTPGKILVLGVTYEGLYKGMILGLKIFLGIGYSLIFVFSVPLNEIAKSLDWLTFRRLRLGEIIIVSHKFVELVKSSPYKSTISTLRYAVEKSSEFLERGGNSAPAGVDAEYKIRN